MLKFSSDLKLTLGICYLKKEAITTTNSGVSWHRPYSLEMNHRTSLMMGKRRHNFLDLPLNDFNHRYAVWILSFLHSVQKRLILGVITGFWTFFVWWSFSVSILIVVGLNNAMHYLRKTSNIDSRLQGVIPIRWFEPTCIMTVGPINSLRPKAALFEDLLLCRCIVSENCE